MKAERLGSIVAVHLLLIKDGKILLSRRYNTGYEDGNYSVTSGHLEKDETVTQAMVRETKEEAGIDISTADLHCAHVMHRNSDDSRIDFFFTADKWQGEPINKEPDKCDELKWFPMHSLPLNTVPYVRNAIERYSQGSIYSEFGW